jgi:hypothetical protein
MMDLEFYHAGCQPATGKRRLVVGLRRIVRRLLRPMFYHQVAIYRMFHHRIHEVEAKWLKVRASEFDQRAMARRLAILEDQVELLLARADRSGAEKPAATTLPLENRGARGVPRQAG